MRRFLSLVVPVSLAVFVTMSAEAKPTATKRTRPSAGPTVQPTTTRTKKATKSSSRTKAAKKTNSRAKASPTTTIRSRSSSTPVDPRGTGLLASLLLHYAEGGRGGLVGDVRGKVRSSKRNKAAAARLVKAINRASRTKRGQRMGATARRLDKAPSKADFRAVLARDLAFGSIYDLLRPDVLPAESVPQPSSYKLNLVGVETASIEDGDASDELAMWITTARASGNTYSTETHRVPTNGTIAVSAGGTVVHNATVLDSTAADQLIISAVMEDDAGSSADRMAELDVLLDLSLEVATQVGGNDKLQTLASMLSYTAGLMQISGGNIGEVSIEVTRIKANEWSDIYSTPATKSGAVDWKLAIPHAIGTGQYSLLLDVPAELPKRATINARVTNLAPVTPPNHAGWVYQLSIEACIKGACLNKAPMVTPGVLELGGWRVERDVIYGDVTVEVSAKLRRRRVKRKWKKYGKWRECAENHPTLKPCPWEKKGAYSNKIRWYSLDLHPSNGTGTASVTWKVRSRRRNGNKLVKTLTGNNGNVGRVTIQVEVDRN